MGGKLGKKGVYMIEENPEDQTAEGSGTEMEEPSSGNSSIELEEQTLQEEGNTSSSQVHTENERPMQRETASMTEEFKSADPPVGMSSRTDQPDEMTTAGSGFEPPSGPHRCIIPENVSVTPAEVSEEDPIDDTTPFTIF